MKLDSLDEHDKAIKSTSTAPHTPVRLGREVLLDAQEIVNVVQPLLQWKHLLSHGQIKVRTRGRSHAL